MTRQRSSERLAELDAQMEAPGFWDDQRAAARLSAEQSRVQRKLDTYQRLADEASELDNMLELVAEDADWKDELSATLARLNGEVDLLQEEALFTGEYDAGTGGRDACMPAPAAPTARTGPRCCCACTCAGRSGAGSSSRCSRRRRVRRRA